MTSLQTVDYILFHFTFVDIVIVIGVDVVVDDDGHHVIVNNIVV